MAITAAQVKELRDRTGISMMKCKEAMEKCDGDMEKAVEWLRKQGLEAGNKRADKACNAGSIGIATAAQGGVMVLLGCETDFVANNEEFKAAVDAMAKAALAGGLGEVAALEAATVAGQPGAHLVKGLIAKLGENIKIVNVKRLAGAGVVAYNHGNRVAVLVSGSGDAEALRLVAMHVAASVPPPVSLDRASVDPAVLAKEKEIIAATPEVQAKPEAIRPKIVEGKLGRFYKEQVLLEQEMLLKNDDHSSVEKWAAARGATVTGFVRLDA